MRKQIAAANWKMNLTYEQAKELLDTILKEKISLAPHQQAVVGAQFDVLQIDRLGEAGPAGAGVELCL